MEKEACLGVEPVTRDHLPHEGDFPQRRTLWITSAVDGLSASGNGTVPGIECGGGPSQKLYPRANSSTSAPSIPSIKVDASRCVDRDRHEVSYRP
jgi:hypothetical protein